jgi:SpoVK/Ycf46/Vps4 family AAA+-type ATPase
LQLATDVIDIVRSLSGKATVRLKVVDGTTYYRVRIVVTFNPFKLTRKANLWKINRDYMPCRIMDKIEYVGEKETQCIRVKAANSLYLTDHYVVTHNTSLIRYVLNQILDKDAIVIFMEGSSFFSTDFVKKIQKTLKDRFKVFIFEELTGQTAYTDRLERLLTFLDGELSVDKSISFATTNYPENLPRNVADRPSRFDKLYEVKPPAEAERKKLLEFFLKKEPTKEELEASKDFSPAHIKEIALMHLIQKQGIMEAINKLKLRTRLVDKAFAEAKNGGGFGFN